jgi:hypothetical protein
VDVEEWYHSCWVPEYVHPDRRPPLAEELDELLPELLERFDHIGLRATFFVLGEVAERLPQRIREVLAAGHEVACHGQVHLRADDRPPERFRADIVQARDRLEQVTGVRVLGFRSPEWSLRSPANPRFRVVAEEGFAYDSSLMPAPGAGRSANPRLPVFATWPDGAALLELPPLVWGGPLGLPAGGWCGRCAPVSWVRHAVDRSPFALLVVHPWELVDRAVPGFYAGFARFFHEAGRRGYGERFERLVDGLKLRTLREIAAEASFPSRPEAVPVEETGTTAAAEPAPGPLGLAGAG